MGQNRICMVQKRLAGPNSIEDESTGPSGRRARLSVCLVGPEERRQKEPKQRSLLLVLDGAHGALSYVCPYDGGGGSSSRFRHGKGGGGGILATCPKR